MGSEYSYLRTWWYVNKGANQDAADFAEGMVKIARLENAPNNAVYRAVNGRWITVDDIDSGEMLALMLSHIEAIHPASIIEGIVNESK